MSRRTVSRWVTLAVAALALVTAIAGGLGVYAIVRLSNARSTVVDRNGPAALAALQLTNALLNQETGVRGYALSGAARSLEPYRKGRADATAQAAQLAKSAREKGLHAIAGDLARVQHRVELWRRTYARPTIANVQRDGPRAPGAPSGTAGRHQFDGIRRALATLNDHIGAVRLKGRADLASAASFLSGTFVAILLLVGIAIATLLIGLRAIVNRPLERLGREVRRTAQGDFEHEIAGAGPRDLIELAEDVDSMRRRIVEELTLLQATHARLDEQAQELQRSNAELEQFAYVASHDLQEPLRKVASFCQLLEQRYGEQLDERGQQYVWFAVDGAKRMQQLINDLLAFSRVGQSAVRRSVIEMDAVVQQARVSLATAIEETRAQIDVAPLPQVRGEPGLLAVVFQNLIGNALKFHRDGAPPHVEVGVERDGDEWRFACSDDGIGIEPQHAERIFMIFQRLHSKEAYAGTGIGLAMCRKIVEFHGGRIWLDTEIAGRTTFRFTLPTVEETRPHEHPPAA